MADTIEPGQNTIDVCDVKARLEELATRLGPAFIHDPLAARDQLTFEDWAAQIATDATGQLQEDAQELIDLRQLVDQLLTPATTLIHDSYFEQYARDLADDIGLPAGWPADYIDWEAAANALQRDYRSCEYVGQTYWYR